MIVNHSLSTEPIARRSGPPRALVVGGGIPALVAAQTLAAMSVHVTFAHIEDTPTHLYGAQSSEHREDVLASLSQPTDLVTTVPVAAPPAIRRSKEGFVARFTDGSSSMHDCLVVAPGIALRPKPSTIPAQAELFTSDMDIASGERIVFVLDYLMPSDPALGMTAMKVATRNVLSGGRSVVCFRHVPVRQMYGEKLYDEARKAGVQFVRFGTEPPTIRLSSGGDTPLFRIHAHDLIDREEELAYESDRLTVVTGPDPSSLVQWARIMASKDLDGQGFVLSDSVHCHSGKAMASGMFLVGEGTGSLDLMNCIAQAKSAAIQALAWIKASRVKNERESITVGSGCVRCLTCHRVCPHEAIPPLVDPLRARMSPVTRLCRDCGLCASVCPAMAIHLPACPDESMIRFVSERSPLEIERSLFVFGCQRSAGRIAQSIQMPEDVRFLPVPCAGSVSEQVIWSGLAAGARGVLVVGCHHGNCASHTGTDWAAARVRRALESGVFAGDAPRVGYATVAANQPGRFLQLVSGFLAKLPA